MKFEGPTPETETRQVSVSFAAFIVVAAFALFGIAMAVNTVITPRAPAATQAETIPPPEENYESPPPSLPAVTQPDPTAVTEPDPAESSENEPAPEAAQPAPVLAAAPAPRNPASETAAAGAPPADTHDASFPTHRAAKPAAPATASPTGSN